ncbi:Rieske (2Fe-2S) protein [Brevibacillus sp. FSL K6-0770]|uniref:Rieske (2Fe-2S) protein n=1 Tax=Brevibacillus TaxID=55080 RepID=UPI00156AB08A|nr:MULTISPECIES: Rieske (2Fe-2S) protein [Brevibacillus]MBU8715499.1 Rieske 2Fe-2S domain-containing protein [Brevibacillus parabrevis]NRQ54554.1 Rieske (2Fe-2S) protein [Brevibacillus sp. HD1.4A]
MNEEKQPRSDRNDTYTHNIVKSNERSLDRRGFMKTLVGAAGLFAVSTLPWGAMAAQKLLHGEAGEQPRQKIAEVAALRAGDAKEFAYPGTHDSALLVCVREGEYKAYQNACPHLKCPVFWSKENHELLCPCHHGKFDVETGNPLAGPPRRPLPEIELAVEHGVIYAIGVKPYEA